MSVAAYPLQWPAARPRRAAALRKTGRFGSTQSNGSYRAFGDLTVAKAVDRLRYEVTRAGGTHLVISTNIELRQDGFPRSDRRAPDDPGAAAYFQLAGKPICMPCDTYTEVAQNIAAIAAHIEATRAIERHGVASMSEMFAGFVALPPPRDAWEILGVRRGASRAEIEKAFRAAAVRNHPDRGGSNAAMAEVNAARESLLREVA